MCCSSVAAKSPMAEFLKSQLPQELWKASLKPKDLLAPADPAKPGDPLGPTTAAVAAAKAPGTGLLVDRTV